MPLTGRQCIVSKEKELSRIIRQQEVLLSIIACRYKRRDGIGLVLCVIALMFIGYGLDHCGRKNKDLSSRRFYATRHKNVKTRVVSRQQPRYRTVIGSGKKVSLGDGWP